MCTEMYYCHIWPAGSYAIRSLTARVPTHEDDTHEDFKPKFNVDAEPRSESSVAEQIEQDVKQNPVFLYMKVNSNTFQSMSAALSHACPPISWQPCLMRTTVPVWLLFPNSWTVCRVSLKHPSVASATWLAESLMHMVSAIFGGLSLEAMRLPSYRVRSALKKT